MSCSVHENKKQIICAPKYPLIDFYIIECTVNFILWMNTNFSYIFSMRKKNCQKQQKCNLETGV